MPTLHLLGTGAAHTDAHRTTTMLALSEAGRVLLIDCGGDVIQRAMAAGLSTDLIDGLFITHEHPDHVAGFPLFMEKIWLSGRKRPIDVYGIRPALDQAKRLMECFDTSGWDLPTIQWHEVEYKAGAVALENDLWKITVAPGVHGVPVVGLRIESLATGRNAAYSCDTEPCDAIERLAENVDLLIHEANGPVPGHSGIGDAVALASRAGAKTLVLIHLPPGTRDAHLKPFRSDFASVRFAEELDAVPFVPVMSVVPVPTRESLRAGSGR